MKSYVIRPTDHMYGSLSLTHMRCVTAVSLGKSDTVSTDVHYSELPHLWKIERWKTVSFLSSASLFVKGENKSKYVVSSIKDFRRNVIWLLTLSQLSTAVQVNKSFKRTKNPLPFSILQKIITQLYCNIL